MYFGNSGSTACVSGFLNLKLMDWNIFFKKENRIIGYLREVVAYALVCIWKNAEMIRTSDCHKWCCESQGAWVKIKERNYQLKKLAT